MPPTNFVKVDQLTPNSLNVDLVVKVLHCDASLQCLGGSQFSSVTVGDETGTVILRLPAQQARFDPGSTLVLRSARAETCYGQLRLELGRWSRLALADSAKLTPKLQNDMSAVQYCLTR
ncbi:unnamed protein product [Cladocopium goreaui]|uniref:Single-stranded DNA binding protein Ssb-like OB fold domain-containing protein n=1 Tax=Cladocopium goreaui TaxID=2562237 RepID=A0A9P1CWA1_9DINO|nr:unnamed protein product [Cladocopium goreaui]|mmetsp:Transcript_16902/g.37392  ORF Transcript_16902/g.37392 Transcript_16902/m.37392 type:complete len:119 (-) Transcript_16902:59-415(-)